MNSVIDQNIAQRAAQTTISPMTVDVAANDDHVPGGSASRPAEITSGWNAYDVWRRLIKDARDRRTSGK